SERRADRSLTFEKRSSFSGVVFFAVFAILGCRALNPLRRIACADYAIAGGRLVSATVGFLCRVVCVVWRGGTGPPPPWFDARERVKKPFTKSTRAVCRRAGTRPRMRSPVMRSSDTSPDARHYRSLGPTHRRVRAPARSLGAADRVRARVRGIARLHLAAG